jgi:hypothetical protein
MSGFVEVTQAVNDELACTGCGAFLKFKPGTRDLACEYCGAQNEIPIPPGHSGEVQESSLEEFLAKNTEQGQRISISSVKCNSCAATTTLDPSVSSDKCPFCASALVIQSGSTADLIKPQYILPFSITAGLALEKFKRWLRSLWFAPNDLKHYADTTDRLSGMYLPYWTFDCKTDTSYVGQRGINYQTTESYTAVENGKNVRKTRTVTKTRWSPASGRVSNVFDDILIEATQQLPKEKLRALEPWDVENFVPYDDKYLSGFRTVTYDLDLKSGYREAKQRMEPGIYDTINRDIGGDRQRINYINVTYNSPTFKHALMPFWISAYRYGNKVYQIIINARTGEVQGDRPYSVAKISLLAVIVILGILATVYFTNR